MSTLNIFSIVLSAYLILTGLASLVTGKYYGSGRMFSRYTEESVRAFIPFNALGNLSLGGMFLANSLLSSSTDVLFKIGDFAVPTTLALLIGGVVLDALFNVVGSKKLVKKESACAA